MNGVMIGGRNIKVVLVTFTGIVASPKLTHRPVSAAQRVEHNIASIQDALSAYSQTWGKLVDFLVSLHSIFHADRRSQA